jgi:hypothetical protein
MKTLILSLAIFSSLATWAQTAQDPSSPSAAPGGLPVTPPSTGPAFNNNTNTVFPWQIGAGSVPGRLNRLLVDLQEDIEAVVPTLAALSDNVDLASQAAAADSAVAQYAGGNGMLPARDLSTLVSKDLSANLGQNLATSLAVPTSPPWSTWGNGPRMVLANAGGAVVTMPTLPPRTAWGNGPGVVVTTPGGAVYSLVPAVASPTTSAPDRSTRDVLRQLSIVQDDLDRVLRYLASMTNNVVQPAPAPAPGSPPVYLTPTGR